MFAKTCVRSREARAWGAWRGDHSKPLACPQVLTCMVTPYASVRRVPQPLQSLRTPPEHLDLRSAFLDPHSLPAKPTPNQKVPHSMSGATAN